MADENPTGRASLDPSSPSGADKRTERAVLALLLDEHPIRLTMDELILVLHADPERGDPEDAGQRAVRELVGAGLVHREGRFLAPSRAGALLCCLGVALMDVAGQFGDNLVRVRKHARMSQDELSVRASVHRTEISQLERGLRIARIDTLVKLAGSLEVDPSDLLAGIVWSPGDVRRGQFRERVNG